MHRSLPLAAALATTLGVSAAAQPAPAPAAAPVPVAQLVRQINIPFEQFTLSNGLRVIVHTDRKAPVVGIAVWYDVGSKHEPAGKTGFAHLFEHLMFNGSENAPGDYFEGLQQMGATDYNGTTDSDRTNYFQTVPTPALERALYLESDRMGHMLGAITQPVLDEQRGVVQNEKRQGDTQPFGLVRYRMVEGLLPPTHPYGHSTIGSMADLDAASLGDVRGWFRDHYGPNNAVLVLAGDIDTATARTLVQRYFGDIPRGPATRPVPTTIPALPAPKVEVMKDRVATTRIYRMWAVPGANDPESVQLDVAAGVLGGLSSSRLDNALVRREKLAVSVSAGNQGWAQLGIFMVSADVRPGVDPALVGRRLDQLIAELRDHGPTLDEVRRVATTALTGRIASLEAVGGFGGKAVTLAQGALFTGDPARYRKDMATLAAATPQSVRMTMAKWLSRPVFSLIVEPGPRTAYTEAARAEPIPPAPETPVKGTRPPAPPIGDVRALQFPAVTRARLSNGIELVYARRSTVPITQAVLSFDAGVAADVPARLGTQSLTLAMLDEGTTTRDSIQLAEGEERLGASIGSGATADRTYLSLFVPSQNLAGGLELFADITRNPAFAPAEVERLKNQQLARIAAELTSPSGLAARALPPLIYGAASPYAKAAAGSGDPAAVAALTRDDLIAFHRAWLRPDKAKLFVVSDRPLEEIRAAFQARFGDWRAQGPAGTKTFTPPAQAVPRIVLIDRPDSPQSLIRAGLLTSLAGDAELLPQIAANDTLGGSFLSRINMELREKRHWSYGARGSFTRLEHAVPYVINAPVQADKTGASIQALRDVLAAYLGPEGISPAEFDRTIANATRALAGNFETADDVLQAMQTNDLYLRPDDYYTTLAEKYRALTRPQLDAAARAAIDPARLIWVVVGDAKTVRPQLDTLGLPVEVVAAASLAGTGKQGAK